jgi:hypothetical protein
VADGTLIEEGALQAARREKSLLKRVFDVKTPLELDAQARVRGAYAERLRAAGVRDQLYGRKQQQLAGIQGEDSLTWALSALPDDWVMLRGYRNRRGETDHVLVGPLGVWAVEVKNRAVSLHVAGDQWWYEKFDRNGRLVDSGQAVDGGGRSWAHQVNDVAGDLARWLCRRGYRVPVRTAVILMHERARLVRCRQLSVDLLGIGPGHLVQGLQRYAVPLSPQDCDAIVSLVCRDHRYHAGRREQWRRH